MLRILHDFISSNLLLINLWEVATVSTVIAILWMAKLTLGRLTQLGDAGAGSQALLFEFQAHCYHHLWILLLCIHDTKFHIISEALNRTRFLKGVFVFKYNFVLRKFFLNKRIICIKTMECHRILQLQINYRSLELWPLRSPVSSTNS